MGRKANFRVDTDTVWKMFTKQKMSIPQIARKIGIAENSVHYHLRKKRKELGLIK